METLNMRSAALSELMIQISNQLEDHDYTPVIIIGKSGIGKTESIRELAETKQIGYRELRLSHYQESDLVGLPYISENGFTRHAPTDLLPDPEDKGQGILLLDEVTAAPKSMRSAVYQLMDIGRGLGRYKLPENWIVVACGNGPDDGGDFRGIEPAFLSRAYCWRAEEDFITWKKWALKNGVHPSVIAFLGLWPENLHVMMPDRPCDMIACPRNWVKLSTQLKNLESRAGGSRPEADRVSFSAEGCVGIKCGAAFSAFFNSNADLIDPSDIINGKILAEQMSEEREEILYLTAQNLVNYVAVHLKSEGTGSIFIQSDADDLIVRACDWAIDLGEKVRLDAAVLIFHDLVDALGPELSSFMLSERFRSRCPRFAGFAVDNALVFG